MLNHNLNKGSVEPQNTHNDNLAAQNCATINLTTEKSAVNDFPAENSAITDRNDAVGSNNRTDSKKRRKRYKKRRQSQQILWRDTEIDRLCRENDMLNYELDELKAKSKDGQYIKITGADDNLYLFSILKAFREFIGEEIKENSFTELRLTKKISAARALFPEDMKSLKCRKICVYFNNCSHEATE